MESKNDQLAQINEIFEYMKQKQVKKNTINTNKNKIKSYQTNLNKKN